MKNSSYISGNSLIHRLDPRGKLLFTLLSSLYSVLCPSLPISYCLVLLSILLSLFSVGVRESFLNIRRILLLSILILVLSPLQHRSGEGIVYMGSLLILTREALVASLLIDARFIFISLMFSILLETTREESLILALRSFGLSYSKALTLTLTLSFIPTFSSDYLEIRDAMSLRMNEEKRREGLFAVLVAVIVKSIKAVPERSAILEERAFIPGRKRSSYRKLENTPASLIFIAISVILPVAFIIFLYL